MRVATEATALARLFEAERRRGQAIWFSLPGGATLFDAGEQAQSIYYLAAGRLGAFRHEEGQEPQFLGIVRPGEPVGEMALIAETAHTAKVVALRNSELYALTRSAFFDAADRDPEVMTELARLMILRTRQAANKASIGEPSVFGFVAASPELPVRPMAERIALAIEELGYTVEVVGAETARAPTHWFSDLERAHDFVLYVAEAGDGAWKSLVARQSDRLFRVGDGDLAPPPELAQTPSEPLQHNRLVDLVLVHPAAQTAARGGPAWLDAARPARLFHARDADGDDDVRLARVLTGQSVGLVLSGGGARAYAHVGAVRALRERRVPIDFVGGASMGAIVAAGVAMGWDDAEMDRRLRAAFVDTSPLDDIALPILAMTHGRKVAERLAYHFGDIDISDLWLPYFCVSSNLTSGAYHLHKRGLLRDALRATVALPGVMPPATEDNNVLVDGAVLKNFPADIMRSSQLGPIVGVDVTRGRSITADEVARPSSVWRWIWSGEWRKGPPIVSLLMRAATVSTGRDLVAAREATDLLILPDVSAIEIRDWKAYEPAVEAGYRATIAALDKLEHAVVDLRRRPSLAG